MTGAQETVSAMKHFNLNSLISLFFLQGGKVGSNLFILGGGIFLIEQSEFRIKNALKIWLITFFYSVFLNLVDVIIFHQSFTAKEWIKMCLPITGGYYWFSRSYILLILMLPLIHSIMKKMEGKESRCIDILIMTWTTVLITSTVLLNGSLVGNRWIRSFFSLIGKGPLVFAYLIMMLTWIKRKGILERLTSKTGLILAIVTWILMWLIEIFLLRKGIDTNNQILINHYGAVRDLPSILCILCAFGFFICFYKMRIEDNRYINSIAGLVFGVYLVQCHSRIIWEGLFDFPNYLMRSTGIYLLYALIAVTTFFFIGTCFELVRKKVFGKFEKQLISHKSVIKAEVYLSKIYEGIDRYINRFT